MNSKRMIRVIIGITLATISGTTPILSAVYLQRADAFINQGGNLRDEKAPPSITGDNVYVVWWTDK
jgi:hypothetical protein